MHNPYANADVGPGGASFDGFLYWSSDGSKDRRFPPCSFIVSTGPKENRVKSMFTAPIERGIVIDTRPEIMARGWELNLDNMPKPERVIAPMTRPFPSKDQLRGNPDDWRQCFSIKVATVPGGPVYLWEQSGVVYDFFRDLVAQLGADYREGLVPAIKAIRVDVVQLSRGPVSVPKFQIVGWVNPVEYFGAGPAQAAMQAESGFGAPPAAGGGFGGAPAPGGFGGAPAPSYAAPGGFAPPATAAPGGFGAPPAPSAPGGFGAPPAAAPGGFAPPAPNGVMPGGPVQPGQPEF